MWWRNYSQILFWKMKIDHFSGSIVQNLTPLIFIICHVAGYQNILKLTCLKLTLISPPIKLFNNMKRSNLPYFSYNFRRKIFILLCSINWPNFIVWLALLCKILGNICILIICKPGFDTMNFEVNHIFLIKLFLLLDQNVVIKT